MENLHNFVKSDEHLLDNIANQTVKELNAHYARLNFEVKQRLKEKGLTPNDISRVVSKIRQNVCNNPLQRL